MSNRKDHKRPESNRPEDKQDWRSSDSDLKAGDTNATKASGAAAANRTDEKRESGKREGDKHTEVASDSKSRSADSSKNRDQRL